MILFHRHRFTECARTYAPPLPVQYVQHDWPGRCAQHGVTTLTFRCTHPTCGKLKTVQMLGKA